MNVGTILLMLAIILTGCDFQRTGSQGSAQISEEPDFESLFQIHTGEIPTSADDEALVFEHWTTSGWITMHTNEIPEYSRGEAFSFYWMLGLAAELEVIYGLPNFRGGYRLPPNTGKIVFKGINEDSDGWNSILYREFSGGVEPCLRVRTSKATREQASAGQPATRSELDPEDSYKPLPEA